MKTELQLVKEGSIEDFAEEHNLVMQITEREDPKWFNTEGRFYAHFKSCEVSKGNFLHSISGDGRTPDEAVSNYAKLISQKRLIIDAMSKNRRDIRAWRFI